MAVVAVRHRLAASRHRRVRPSLLVRDDGPGGPLLVVVGAGFSRYLVEILRAEGVTGFAVVAAADLDRSRLADHDAVLLGPVTLGGASVADLTEWVHAGGALVAVRPDPGLAPLLGLEPLGTTQADGYLRVDTSVAPGAGSSARPLQVHGELDLHRLAGARTVAELLDRGRGATGHPAVTVRDVGTAGGRAAAFAYDVGRSVVLTRQGNPAWAGQNRDGDLLTRSDDLFYGDDATDPQADWVDRDLLDVAQADEQQRLLVRLLVHVSRDRRPVLRFWYLPRDLRTAVVMTGDDHALDGTLPRFGAYAELDRPGDDPADWTAVRATSYLYAHSGLTDAEAAGLESAGFELCPHVTTNALEWTLGSLADAYRAQVAAFRRAYPSVSAPLSHRTHAVVWSDWSTQAEVERAHGMRLDTNYYLYPAPWAEEGTGHFTGSGLPMRFATADGEVIDCYQVVTQLNDESEQRYPEVAEVAIGRALASGGATVLTANMHTDLGASIGSDAIVGEARRRGVPVISARQLLTWIDGRAASSVHGVAVTGDDLRFTVVADPRARGLTLLVPVPPGRDGAALVTREGDDVTTVLPEVVDGALHLSLPAVTGRHHVRWGSDPVAAALDELVAEATSATTARISWRSATPTVGAVTLRPLDGGTTGAGTGGGGAVTVRAGSVETDHLLTATGLHPGGRYEVLVDGATAPAPVLVLWDEPILCDTVERLGTGSSDGTAVSGERGGALVLAPALALEPEVSPSTAGWDLLGEAAIEPLPGGRAAAVRGRVVGSATWTGGRSFEAEVEPQPGGGQQVGLARGPDGATVAAFTTGRGGSLAVVVTLGDVDVRQVVPGRWSGAPHRLRLEWDDGLVSASVDGRMVASVRWRRPGAVQPVLDGGDAGGALVVRWARLSGFAPTGTYTSPVLGRGRTAGWGRVRLHGPATTMTGATVEVRTGATPAVDGTWSDWEPTNRGGEPVAARSAHLQYRVTLRTASARWTPVVTAVEVERVP